MYLKFKQLGLLIFASAALTACSLENMEVPKDELYNRDFIKTFGLIDPNQNWNLVAQRAAKANGQSRKLNDGTHHYDNVTVGIKELTGPHGFLTLTVDAMKRYEKVLPELKGNITDPSKTNLGKVTQNFVAEADEFWLFPEYWDTSSLYGNEIGIYFEVSEPGDNVETIKDYKNDKDVYIRKVKIFEGLIEQLKQGTKVWYDFDRIDNADEAASIYSDLQKYYSNIFEFKIAEGGEQYGSNQSANAGQHLLKRANETYWTVLEYNPGYVKELLVELYPGAYQIYDGKLQRDWGSYASIYNTPVTDGINEGYTIRSYGVHITFSKKTKFGFYIINTITGGGNTLYSETRFNEPVYHTNEDNETISYTPSYAATFLDGKDTAGNALRHLCFEDWYKANFDLNDLVFRAYGFDALRNENPDGDIIDEDKPDPTDKDELIEQGLLVCEDLGVTDDIDFNDVILKLEHYRKTTTEGENTTTSDRLVITPMAAGGTLRSTVIYDDKAGTEQVLGEIHELLGGSAPSIINAYKGSYNGPGKPFEITNVKWDKDKHESGFASQAFEEGYFSIEVEGNNNKVEIITTPSSMGVAPQMMFLPHDWWWPVERQSIKEVYTRFESWVKDVKNTDWHLDHGHSSKLIDHTPHTTCNVCPKK